MHPCVAGGSKGKEGRAVGIREMMSVANGHRSVNRGESGNAGEASRLTREIGNTRVGYITPLTFGIGHEAKLIFPCAIVETVGCDGSVAQGKRRRPLHFNERIARGGTRQDKFKNFPLVDRSMNGLGETSLSSGGPERSDCAGRCKLQHLSSIHPTHLERWGYSFSCARERIPL